jgi:hypothetical protein
MRNDTELRGAANRSLTQDGSPLVRWFLESSYRRVPTLDDEERCTTYVGRLLHPARSSHLS